MDRDRHTGNLAKELLRYCDIDTEGFEESNKALISCDYEATLLLVVDGGLIHLVGFLGQAPASEELYSRLLQENFRSVSGTGYRYAMEPESGELLLSRTVQGTDHDAPSELIDIFLGMVEYIEKWSHSLATGGGVPEADTAGQATDPGPRTAAEQLGPGSFPAGGMRRV